MTESVSGGYAAALSALSARLRESAPARIQLLVGPRQVGKTTLLLELARAFGDAASYVAGDDPAAATPGAWERAWDDAEARAARSRAVLLLDEIQHWPDWSTRLKGRWDRVRRRGLELHVVASGSSALRLGDGSRESLAGRFERVALTHWPASELARIFKLSTASAARELVRFGGYPGAFPLRRDVVRWQAYVRDAVIEPAIGRDVLTLGIARRPQLVRQVFAAAVGMPSEIVSLQKLQGQLERGALETIAQYLSLLDEAYLVAPLEKYSERVLRRRAAPPKLVALNNALISALHPEGPPDPVRDSARFGRWVENACLAHARNTGHQVWYWREEPLEVDGIIDGPWGRWAVEIKTGRFEARDADALLEFTRRYPRFTPLVVVDAASMAVVKALGTAGVTWQDFLLHGPPGRAEA